MSALAKAGHKLSVALDSIRNYVTGAGTGRDKTTFASFKTGVVLSTEECGNLFAHNDLARKIVSKPVEDALRPGFSLRKDGEDEVGDDKASKAIIKELKRLSMDPLGDDKLLRAMLAARTYGGGGLILGALGSGGLTTPLDDSKVTSLAYITAWSRDEMQVSIRYPDGSPEVYQYTPSGASYGPKFVHESRLIHFPAADTLNKAREANGGWNHSVLQAPYEVLLSFAQMWSSVDSMFNDASQVVIKMQGLIQSLADADGEGEGSRNTRTRLELLDMMRSSVRAIMLDAGENGEGEESFSVVERQVLANVDKPIVQYFIRLSAASNMPATVLLSQAPQGMNATGESDLLLYYNGPVDGWRVKVTPALTRLIQLVAKNVGHSGEWTIVWPELLRPKPLDIATTENMRVTSMSQLIEHDVILPEEAALALKDACPGLQLTLDVQSRQKALKEGLTELADREMTAPSIDLPDQGTPPGQSQPGAPKPKASERKTPSEAAKRQV